MFKKIGKTSGILSIALVLSFSFNTAVSTAAPQGKDCVDKNKHLNWRTEFKSPEPVYEKFITSAIKVWESYKPGVIRPASSSDKEVLKIVEYYDVSSRIAQVYVNGHRMELNRYKFKGADDKNGQKKKVTLAENSGVYAIAHEFGHALGLDHTNEGDLMHDTLPFNPVPRLSATDKSVYDAVYAKY